MPLKVRTHSALGVPMDANTQRRIDTSACDSCTLNLDAGLIVQVGLAPDLDDFASTIVAFRTIWGNTIFANTLVMQQFQSPIPKSFDFKCLVSSTTLHRNIHRSIQ